MHKVENILEVDFQVNISHKEAKSNALARTFGFSEIVR
jgi:hypothetical protein